MLDEKKLNIFQKIQKARVLLQEAGIQKTGHNKYSNYYYFELSDFLPQINKICDDLGLYTEFRYTQEEATLTIYDVDNQNSFRYWPMPVEVAQLKGCSQIQNIGGTQSFARRYLYMMAFEIAESDAIDNGSVDQEKIEGLEKINKASVLTINSLIAETKTDINEFLKWANVTKVEDITNNMLGTAINLLSKKKKDIEKKKAEAEKLRAEVTPVNTDQEQFEF